MAADDDTRSELERRLFTRRKFVLGATGIVSGLSATDALARVERRLRAADTGAAITPVGVIDLTPASSLRFMLTRRTDFLFIQVDGFNVVRDGQFLKPGPANGVTPSLLFTFPPQAMVEATIPVGQNPVKPGNQPALLSGPSHLGFTINTSEIPFTVDGLLDWYESQLTPLVVPVAEFGDSFINMPQLEQPDQQTTSIEMPWNLVISPVGEPDNWSHQTAATLTNGSYELWVTRLTTSDGEAGVGGQPQPPAGNPAFPDGGAPLRAVWNYDVDGFQANGYTPKPTLPANLSGKLTPPSDTDPRFPYYGNANDQFGQAVTRTDRWNVVLATSDFALPRSGSGPDGNLSTDIIAKKLWLSARGGFADWEGTFDIEGKTAISLTDWRHVSTAGRDQYVRIVNRGFLFPWGHRATLIATSERVFETLPSTGDTVAVFQETKVIKVLQETVAYDRLDLPFTEIRSVTTRTPAISDPTVSNGGPSNPMQIILPSGDPFRFHFVGTDQAGREASFTAAAWFVEDTHINTPLDTTVARSAYNGLGVRDPTRLSDFGGQTMAFVAPTADKPGGTDSHVLEVTFGAGPADGSNGGPDFAPSLAIETSDINPVTQTPGVYTNAQAVVRLAAAEQLSGGGALPNNSTPAFAYHTAYVEHGFSGGNPGEVYLAAAAVPANGSDPGNQLAGLASSALSSLVYGNGSSGGLSTPNVSISGLSRSLGPFGGLPDEIAQGKFDPTSFFKGLDSAQFLGGLSLGDILATVNDFTGTVNANLRRADERQAHDNSAGGPSVPQISYTDGTGPTGDPELITTVTWSPQFASTDATAGDANYNPANLWFTPGDSFAAMLTGTITTDLVDKSKSSYGFTGTFSDFTFTLISTADGAGLIAIHFDALAFKSGKGMKTKVTPSGLSVQFIGPLEFLNDLQDLISAFSDFDGSGGGSGASISVTPAGVVAELSVAIPPVELAIFTLSGISFAAIATVPLDGVSMSTFEFDFANANDPFTIGGGIFGGGGYFELVVGTKHVQSLTISLDFGAVVALDIIVASGSVQLTAGFTYMLMESSSGQSYTLTGFVKLNGSLSILGIVTLTVLFDLQLSYTNTPVNSLTGTATVTISISLFCFTVPVSMTVTKTFNGPAPNAATSHALRAHDDGSARPTFANQWLAPANQSPNTYNPNFLTYLQAFETA